MDVLDKFLNHISYKFPKGYPDMNDANDISLLENILDEMGINLNELVVSPHWSERKAERGKIIDIINYNDSFPASKKETIKMVEDELSKRLSRLEKTPEIPISDNSTVAYRIINPMVKLGDELIPLKLKTLYNSGGGEKTNTGTTYVAVILRNELITLLLVNGTESDILSKVKAHDTRIGKDRPAKLLSAVNVDYVVNPTKITVDPINPSTLPYTLKTSYGKNTGFEHDIYGTGKIKALAGGQGMGGASGGAMGKLEWIDVDFGKPYLKGGKFMTTRRIENVYTLNSPRIAKNINESSTPSSRYGYKIGEFITPSETLESRNWNFTSKIGYMGTGYYFYGDKETALEDQAYLKRGEENIKQFPLSNYKLFRADNPEEFYDTIKMLTRELGIFASSGEELSDTELDDALQEIVDVVKTELKLPLSNEQILSSVKSFIRDVQEKAKGTLLSNRLLVHLGFEGIDNTNTNLDNYGVGSVIFTG